MVSEKQGNDSDPVEIEQYTEIFLLKEIRMTLKEIRNNVRSITAIVVIAAVTTVTVLFGVLIGNLISSLF